MDQDKVKKFKIFKDPNFSEDEVVGTGDGIKIKPKSSATAKKVWSEWGFSFDNEWKKATIEDFLSQIEGFTHVVVSTTDQKNEPVESAEPTAHVFCILKVDPDHWYITQSFDGIMEEHTVHVTKNYFRFRMMPKKGLLDIEEDKGFEKSENQKGFESEEELRKWLKEGAAFELKHRIKNILEAQLNSEGDKELRNNLQTLMEYILSSTINGTYLSKNLIEVQVKKTQGQIFTELKRTLENRLGHLEQEFLSDAGLDKITTLYFQGAKLSEKKELEKEILPEKTLTLAH